ncbi:MAG: copper homeostasis protein CutC [Candidatus Symbiothrix sp.]|nr:copper homeostasis protein CutC [Candidatus Symbiothrix sp.]
MILEVCIDSIQGAHIVKETGAQRVELCANLPEGGVTPSLGTVEKVCEILSCKTQVHVLIRPRGGDFLYSDDEYAAMLSDIACCGKAHCNGVVIGMLHPDGRIDKVRCQAMVALAHRLNMSVTFHRAFDRSCDLFQSLEDCIEIGCDRILTSGGYESAVQGKHILKALIEQANRRIIVMPGAGITPDNAAELIRATDAQEIHGTFRSLYRGQTQYENPNFSRQAQQEYWQWLPDARKIDKIVALF